MQLFCQFLKLFFKKRVIIKNKKLKCIIRIVFKIQVNKIECIMIVIRMAITVGIFDILISDYYIS